MTNKRIREAVERLAEQANALEAMEYAAEVKLSYGFFRETKENIRTVLDELERLQKHQTDLGDRIHRLTNMSQRNAAKAGDLTERAEKAEAELSNLGDRILPRTHKADPRDALLDHAARIAQDILADANQWTPDTHVLQAQTFLADYEKLRGNPQPWPKHWPPCRYNGAGSLCDDIRTLLGELERLRAWVDAAEEDCRPVGNAKD